MSEPREAAEPPGAGAEIRRLSWSGTVVFAATAVAAVVVNGLRPLASIVAFALFGAGCVAFVVSFVRAVRRSRGEQIAVASLYFMSGSAPRRVRRSLLAALTVQVVVALATALARPYTSLAAGTLVPVYGLGLCGLWAARHGTFPARDDLPPAGGRRRPDR